MSCHYHIGLINYRAVGRKLDLLQFIVGLVDKRQTCVAVYRCISVTREVLAGGYNTLALQTLYILFSHSSHYLRVGREGTQPDNGV